MDIAYSVILRDSIDFKRVRVLSNYMLLELNITDPLFISEGSVGDITDPLENIKNIIGVKVRMPNEKQILLDYLEKVIIISEELGSNRVVFEVGDENEYLYIRKLMDEIYCLFSNYKIKFVLESGKVSLMRVYKDITEYLGGVFGLSVTNDSSTDLADMIRAIHNCLRMLEFIKICNFDCTGKPKQFFKCSSIINILDLLNFIFKIGYDNYLVINYEERGLRLSEGEVVSDIRKIKEISRSIIEKG
ncbi:MAG: hypothetical protein B6U94_01700 [Thermofilum sp. ex4484_79]|nr:MAG: hypothetical protein B6U94_01700 [Thermofilum sp. ex4484_79]